jgi:hypothetical protein
VSRTKCSERLSLLATAGLTALAMLMVRIASSASSSSFCTALRERRRRMPSVLKIFGRMSLIADEWID